MNIVLQALKELEVPSESMCVRNLENQLTWNTRGCSIKELVMMLSFCIGRRKSESQKKLFNEVTRSLERRWVEIKGNENLFLFVEIFLSDLN